MVLYPDPFSIFFLQCSYLIDDPASTALFAAETAYFTYLTYKAKSGFNPFIQYMNRFKKASEVFVIFLRSGLDMHQYDFTGK